MRNKAVRVPPPLSTVLPRSSSAVSRRGLLFVLLTEGESGCRSTYKDDSGFYRAES